MISHGKSTGTVLDEIVASKREALLEAQREISLSTVRETAESAERDQISMQPSLDPAFR